MLAFNSTSGTNVLEVEKENYTGTHSHFVIVGNRCRLVDGENVVLQDEWENVDGRIERCHLVALGKDSGDGGCGGGGRNDGGIFQLWFLLPHILVKVVHRS